MAHQVADALIAGTAMMVFALAIVIALNLINRISCSEQIPSLPRIPNGLEESLTGMRTTAAAIEERHAGQLQARDERIAALTADFARKEADYVARLAELDGVRKHALRQIDESRTESRRWKAEFDRVDAENKSTVVLYRQKASSLEADLAGARGRLGAIEEALAASRLRSVQLEAALSAVRPDAAGADAVPQRLGAGRVRGAALIKRR